MESKSDARFAMQFSEAQFLSERLGCYIEANLRGLAKRQIKGTVIAVNPRYGKVVIKSKSGSSEVLTFVLLSDLVSLSVFEDGRR